MHKKFKNFVPTESPTSEKSRSGYQQEAIGEEMTDAVLQLCSFLSMLVKKEKQL
jgi:hypothetical protein